MAAIYSNGGNRWNILGFNFTKRDALSSVYKIYMAFKDNFDLIFVFFQILISKAENLTASCQRHSGRALHS